MREDQCDHRRLRLALGPEGPEPDEASYSLSPSCSKPPVRRLSSSNNEDRDAILLCAIEPPDHSRLSLDDTLRHMKLANRKKRCFKQLLQRVDTNVWTLRFSRDYERAYCVYLYAHAIARIRYAVAIALVFLTLKTAYEQLHTRRHAANQRAWARVLLLDACVAIPVLVTVLLCTFVRRLDRFYEVYGAAPFITLAYVFTAQKIVLGTRGPVFSLFLLFVPVFGIPRFRFLTSVIVVALMFTGHIGGLLLFQHAEAPTDVLFQAYNYLGGIVVGAVCHYRAEVLRRRNYVMLLPFCDEPLDVRHLRDPQLKKHTLMHCSTLHFRNDTVDETFYRQWYVIDPCPFDHPNAGELHRTVYRSVRFAVGGVVFAQLLLVVQDWAYLGSDSVFPRAAYIVATCLRFTIAAHHGRGSTSSLSTRSGQSASSVSDMSSRSYIALDSPLSERHDNHIEASPPAFRNNYVRFLQCLSTVVVFCHALAMGAILLLVDELASQRNASVAPCYFLGFLNVLLFPHRSGFRVRFVYATIGTVGVALIFLAADLAVDNSNVPTYASYMALTNVLGMMISHEEESLRRIFFVRMMLRSDEFQRRHDAILTLEPWFKDLIRRRRRRLQHQHVDVVPVQCPALKIPTVNQMAQASRVGMSLELGRAAIALLAELV